MWLVERFLKNELSNSLNTIDLHSSARVKTMQPSCFVFCCVQYRLG